MVLVEQALEELDPGGMVERLLQPESQPVDRKEAPLVRRHDEVAGELHGVGDWDGLRQNARGLEDLNH